MNNIQAESVAITDNVNKTNNNPRKIKPIRSFVRRARTLSPQKQQVVDQWAAQYVMTYSTTSSTSATPIDFAKVFCHPAPLIIEIGFGMGEGLMHLAQTMPDKNFLGIEVHKPGIVSILRQLQQNPLPNIRIYEHDAVEIFQHCIPDDSVEAVLLNFPDPWPKRRHHKRRIIQQEFAKLIAAKLRCGGKLQISTDCDDYAAHCLKVLAGVREISNFIATSELGKIQTPKLGISTATRILTKFEQRGLKLGHKISNLVFVKEQ